MVASAHLDDFAARHLPPREQWPVLLKNSECDYPPYLNCVGEFLDRWIAEGHGGAICLISPSEQVTYRDLRERVNRIANVLVGRCGLVPGNRVLLRSANTVMMAACYLAVLKAGGIVVATMPLLRAAEIAFPLRKAEIAFALCDARLADDMESAKGLSPGLGHLLYWGDGRPDSLESLMAQASPDFTAVRTAADDVCLIAFTSGTTGVPKGTMHFHSDMLTICDGYAATVVQSQANDRFIGTAPFAFTFGLAVLLFPLRVGAAAILLDQTTPAQVATAIDTYRATVCFTAPTAYKQMSKAPPRNGSLRICVSAGEVLPRATFDAWHAATGLPLIDGIGGTEMLHIYISGRPDDLRPGATGKPVPGFEARIVDDRGNEMPVGEVGRLAVRGPLGCRYLDDARQTNYVQNGWNYPGDTYLVDEDGYFWYQARNDDMIVSSGYNIAGPEVEEALLRHPDVVECAVVAAPDNMRGTIVKAYVVPAANAAAGTSLVQILQDFVKAQIAPYKYPREIAFVTELPRTASGKIQRFELRKRAQEESKVATSFMAAQLR